MIIKFQNKSITVDKNDAYKECIECNNCDTCSEELGASEVYCYFLYNLFTKGEIFRSEYDMFNEDEI
jgi:hypothetical protein